MATKIKLGNGNWGVKDGGTLAYNDENGVFKAIELASSRASGATYVAQSGLIADAEVGVPRIDWTNGVGELLLEPASTNICQYSENFGAVGFWIQAECSITLNTGVAPDGSLTADTMTPNVSGNSTTAGNASTNNRLYSAPAIGVTGDYTNSIWIKSVSGSNFEFSIMAQVGDAIRGVTTVTATSEWQRVSVTGTFTAESVRFSIFTAQPVYLWGAQTEALGYSTSYIRNLTTGSTSRIADAVTGNSSLGQVINSSEGVLYAEMSALEDTLIFRSIALTDGTSNNRVTIQYSSTSGRISAAVVVGGVVQASLAQNSIDQTADAKIALKYKENDFALWVNGSEIEVDLSGTTFSANTLDKLSFDSGAGFELFYGRIRDLRVYDTALTDAELTTLTTL